MTFIQLPDGRKSKLNCPSRQVSRCHFPVFPMPFPFFPSTKSAFLCFFGLRNPRFRAFRAQNRHFCALFGSGTPIFGNFEHKIAVFVRFCPSKPSFSGFSSTKSWFLCSFAASAATGRPSFATRSTWKAQFCHKKHLEGAVSA